MSFDTTFSDSRIENKNISYIVIEDCVSIVLKNNTRIQQLLSYRKDGD